MTNPFEGQTHLDFCTEHRIEQTRKFIDFTPWPILDVGNRSVVTEALESEYDAPVIFQNTLPCDFNHELKTPHLEYRTVLCLEVIEHVMNPLFLLESIHKKLNTTGTLYLSTPVRNKYGFMLNEKEHVTEYSVEVMLKMMEYAGFRVVKSHTFRSYPSLIQGYRNGAGLIRGTIRMLSQYTQIHKAVKR